MAALALVGLAPSAASAAEPTFGRPAAAATFGVGISVEQAVTLPDGVRRIEALVRTTGGQRTLVTEIPSPGPGGTTLRYEFETELGSIWPNTLVELGFRVTMADGTIAEGPTATVRYEDTRFAWRTLDGEHVRVHWAEGGEAFGRRVLSIGDDAVRGATELLGIEEVGLIDFFVYADDRAFQEVLGPGFQENVGGVAPGGLRTLFASIGSTNVDDPWVGIVVPHELAHVVFETSTRNAYHDPPLWLNEGLAVYLSEGYSFNRRSSVERAVSGGTIMPLHALVGRFPASAERFSLAYGESVAAVDYMIRTHGQDALVRLIRSYADGVTDDEAFEAALGVDVAGFEAGWFDDLGIAAPEPHGPRPAPPGPLPPGWEPAAPGPGATAAPATPGPVPGAPADGGASPLGVGLVVGGLAVLGLAALLLVRRRRPVVERPPEGGG